MIPDKNWSGAVTIRWDTAFDVDIFCVVVADAGDGGGGLPAIFEIVDGEGEEAAVKLEAEIVVQAGCAVKFDDEPEETSAFRPVICLDNGLEIVFKKLDRRKLHFEIVS